MARLMVAEWGMSSVVGPVAYRSPGDKVAEQIDLEVRTVVDEAYASARSVVVGARAQRSIALRLRCSRLDR